MLRSIKPLHKYDPLLVS